jgi:Cu2+-containing amine oxidase
MNINIKHPLEALTIEEINSAVEFFKADKIQIKIQHIAT